MEFLELEFQKWNNHIEGENHKSFHSNEDLLSFLNEIIEGELIFNINFQEGYRVFWSDEKCVKEIKNEPEVQHYLKTILEPHCKKNSVKIHREAASANGQIDMTFTYLDYSVCLEVKKAHHADIERAVSNQLITYMNSEKTKFGIYLILWFKSNSRYNKPTKYDNIEQLNVVVKQSIPSNYNISVKTIDCSKPMSPSKL